MKTIVTLKRFYYKEIEIEINNSMLAGKDDEEISEYLMDGYPYYEKDELFDKASLEYLNTGGAETVGIEDTDRYDIYDDNNNQIYGGHL